MKTIILTLLLGVLSLSAEQYKVGSTLKPFSTKDQFDRPYTYQKRIKYLLVSFDMETGKKANAVFSKLEGTYLPNHRAAYLANIYGMPKIGRAFALPKMKKYPHPILLGDDEHLLDPFPRKEGQVTVVGLNSAGKITSINYWNPGTQAVGDFLK